MLIRIQAGHAVLGKCSDKRALFFSDRRQKALADRSVGRTVLNGLLEVREMIVPNGRHNRHVRLHHSSDRFEPPRLVA